MSGARLVPGAVASPHRAATDAAADVIDRGGTAADAAFAANLMLTVYYPHMCGLGGDLFLLYYEVATETLHCLNGSGRAPELASCQRYRSLGYETVPVRGPLSATVPGAVEAWRLALERFGSQNVEALIEPAAEAAAQGVPVSPGLARWIEATAEELARDDTLRVAFLDEQGRPLQDGDLLRQPLLARTMRTLGERGLADFYRGSIGETIATAFEDGGGLLRRRDLESNRANWVTPISTDVAGVTVQTTPPNSQGIAALQMLNILSAQRALDLEPGSVDQLDAVVRAKYRAFADRDSFVTDPDFADIPVSDLLSAERAAGRDTEAAAGGAHGSLTGDTVYVCTRDRHGNACSLIQSIYYGFGSAFTAGDTGVLVHNRGHYFSLDERDTNRVEPGKRPLHTLMASMAMREGRPCLVFGTMGADGQPQTTVQVLLRILAGSSARAAVAAPRVLSGRFILEDRDDKLYAEEDLGEDVLDGLAQLGHDLVVVPASDERMGHAHAILIGDSGGVAAGSDPRSDGSAVVIDG